MQDTKLKEFPINKISRENIEWHFSQDLILNITKEEDTVFIQNSFLDITVWGDTVEEAKDAFSFVFYSLYKQILSEQNDKLSQKAILIKERINSIITEILIYDK